MFAGTGPWMSPSEDFHELAHLGEVTGEPDPGCKA